MKVLSTRLLGISMLIAGAAISTGMLAQDSGNRQTVEWSADGSTMDISGELRTWKLSRNVRITQDSIIINGDEATLEYEVNSGELTRVTVHGNPVEYHQQLSESQEEVTGNSDTIVFFTDELGESVVELTGNASIESPNFTMRCQSITYLSDQDIIRETVGPCSGALSRQGN